MQRCLSLNLNKTELLTPDLNETGTNTLSGSDLPRIQQFIYLASVLLTDQHQCNFNAAEFHN